MEKNINKMHNKIAKLEESKSGLRDTTLLQLSKDNSLAEMVSGLENSEDKEPMDIKEQKPETKKTEVQIKTPVKVSTPT